MNTQILKIKKLSVSYNNVEVLHIDSLEVNKGDIVGIIGANGAGKTTFINCVLDEVKYKGEVLCNFDKNDIGVQFQTNSYNDLMKVYELIQIVTKKRKFDDTLLNDIKEFEITTLLKKKISSLSGGEKQRLTLFLVLYLKPKVMFFDELTTGLDYEKRQKILKMIYNYSVNKTVFTVTHYFDELQNWANKLLILYKGEVIFWGSLQQLKELYPHYGILKIKDTIETNDFIVIPDVDCNTNILIVKNKAEQTKAMNYLNKKNISFELLPCNIYSLYTLLIYDNTKEVKNA